MKSQIITLLLIGSLFPLAACQPQTQQQSPSTEQEETSPEEPEDSGTEMPEEESPEDSADE